MLVVELKREPGDNPGRARRCNRGRILHVCHWPLEAGKAQNENDPEVRKPV